MRRRWSPDTLSVRPNLYAGKPCRVCGVPVALGEDVHTFHWREERGCAHVACGWYVVEDLEAVTCARKLMALAPGGIVPEALKDEAIALYLGRRVHQIGTTRVRFMPTTIGVCLFNRIKEAERMTGT